MYLRQLAHLHWNKAECNRNVSIVSKISIPIFLQWLMIGQYTFYQLLITMYTGLSLVICIVWRNFLLGTINCFFLVWRKLPPTKITQFETFIWNLSSNLINPILVDFPILLLLKCCHPCKDERFIQENSFFLRFKYCKRKC